jgi:hypothetical protein
MMGTLTDHVTDINRIKTFIEERSTWMTNNIGSFSNCSTVSLPALVITKSTIILHFQRVFRK